MSTSAAASKSKKKGPAPAHQNKIAFHHNPKSKKTAKILNAPIQHCCSKCVEKLEWRKQYRKYKPRTQPGTCNSCEKRNVYAAYHTICVSCTTNSDKARQLLEEWMSNDNKKHRRVCAVCVKEPALPDAASDEDDTIDGATLSRPLKLRELKSLQRREEKKTKKHKSNSNNNNDDSDSDMEGNDLLDPDDHDEEDDFVQAIGGVEHLVVGDAYQQRLLASEQA